MSRIAIVILIYHRHKPLDSITNAHSTRQENFHFSVVKNQNHWRVHRSASLGLYSEPHFSRD
jgi:hypothetical protein